MKKILIILSALILLPLTLLAEEKEANNISFDTQPKDSMEALITLNSLIYVDMYSKDYHTQHPLVCGEGRDFPKGREMVFNNPESGVTIHAVFPEEKNAPVNLNGVFVLHGHFQRIQNKDSYKFKKTIKDYQYFVAYKWEYEK